MRATTISYKTYYSIDNMNETTLWIRKMLPDHAKNLYCEKGQSKKFSNVYCIQRVYYSIIDYLCAMWHIMVYQG